MSALIHNKKLSSKDFNYLLVLFLFYIAFVILWTELSLVRLYTINAAVYDLGSTAESLWLPLHSSFGISSFIYGIFDQSILNYILSPFTLFNSFELLFITQSIFVGITVFPIYFISKHFGLSEKSSFIISVSYFFYFPIAGLTFFDFHTFSFFPFLFISAYACYVYNYRKTSVLLFFISGEVAYPFAIFLILFGLIELFFNLLNTRLKWEYLRVLFYPILITIIGVFSLTVGYVLSLSGPHNIISYIHTANGQIEFPLGNIALTLVIILIPILMFGNFLSRWLLMLIPYITLMIYTRNTVYQFPSIFLNEYSVLFAPFIFLALIDLFSIKSKTRKEKLVELSSTGYTPTKYYRDSRSDKRIISVIVVLILLSLVYQPWGVSAELHEPNGLVYYGNTGPFDDQQTYSYLIEESKLIPTSNPYVLVTNQIPEAFPRELVCGPYRIGPLVMGFPSPVFQNITISDAINNTFPYIAWNGSIVNIPIDYAWATIYDPVFYSKSGNQSMLDIMNILLQSGKYGIEAEAHGTILIKRNYHLMPSIFSPLDFKVTPDSGSSRVKFTSINGSYCYKDVGNLSHVSPLKNYILWYGGCSYIPGIFKNSLSFITSNNFVGNIVIYAILNGSIVNQKTLNFTSSNTSSRILNVTFFQTIPEFTPNNGYYYFIISTDGFSGTLNFTGLNILQCRNLI